MHLPHYNLIHSTCHLNHSHSKHTYENHTRTLWRWVSGKAAGEETMGAVVADLHTEGLILYGCFPYKGSSMGNLAAQLSD